LRQVRGKDKICAGAVLAYGDKQILTLTKKMPQAPQGFDLVFDILTVNAKVLD
jgi:hypothetical protein